MIPEVLYDPSLFLSPHVFLLAILFHRRTFHYEALNDDPTSKISRFRVSPGQTQLPFYIKDEFADHYIFRSSMQNVNSHVASLKPIIYNTMHSRLKMIGRILGYESNVISYTLCYKAGNDMNENSTWPLLDFPSDILT